MPAIVVFGRRWHMAADDLPIPCLLGGIWHALWLVPICVNLSFVTKYLYDDCRYKKEQTGFLAVDVALFSINLVLHFWNMVESSRGSIFQTEKRVRVPYLVMAMTATYIAIMGNNGYGTKLIVELPLEEACPVRSGAPSIDHVLLLRFVVFTAWIVLFIGFIFMLLTLNLFPDYNREGSWAKCCTCIHYLVCCCLPDMRRPAGARDSGLAPGGEDPTQETPMMVISSIFAAVFGTVDMTMTDYLAAIMLVGVRHRHIKPAFTYDNVSPPAWLDYGDDAQQQQSASAVSKPPAADSMARPVAAAAAPPAQGVEVAAGTPPPGVDTAEGLRTVSAGEVVLVQMAPGHAQLPSADDADGMPAPPPQVPPGPIQGQALPPKAGNSPPPRVSAPNAPLLLHASSHAVRPRQLTSASDATGTVGIGRSTMTRMTNAVFGGSHVLGSTPKLLDPTREWSGVEAPSNVGLEVMEDAIHYFYFAMAVYGWKIYMWNNRKTVYNCCALCCGRACGCCRQTRHFLPDVDGAEACCSPVKLMEREAITQITGVDDKDVLYVSYENELGGLLPYYIALDRARQSVVVAIRGSMSLEDVITDLVGDAAELDIPGVPSTDALGERVMWAHRGMHACMKAIYDDILEQGLLEALLTPWPTQQTNGSGSGDASGRSSVKEQEETLLGRFKSQRARSLASAFRGSCASWRLVITGHSLGAGVTGLLGLMLYSRYPTLRAWAYAPPAGLLSTQAAVVSREFCVTVVHAKDMIPRLGVNTMEQLVQEMVTAAAHCGTSKGYLMAYMILWSGKPSQGRVFLPYEKLGEGQRQALELYARNVEAANIHDRFRTARGFEPPGHVLYLERHKVGPDPCCSCNICMEGVDEARMEYSSRWIDPMDLVNGGLVVSRSMFLDHLPDNTLRGMVLAYQKARVAMGLPKIKSGRVPPPAQSFQYRVPRGLPADPPPPPPVQPPPQQQPPAPPLIPAGSARKPAGNGQEPHAVAEAKAQHGELPV